MIADWIVASFTPASLPKPSFRLKLVIRCNESVMLDEKLAFDHDGIISENSRLVEEWSIMRT